MPTVVFCPDDGCGQPVNIDPDTGRPFPHRRNATTWCTSEAERRESADAHRGDLAAPPVDWTQPCSKLHPFVPCDVFDMWLGATETEVSRRP